MNSLNCPCMRKVYDWTKWSLHTYTRARTHSSLGWAMMHMEIRRLGRRHTQTDYLPKVERAILSA